MNLNVVCYRFDMGCSKAIFGLTGVVCGVAKQLKLWKLPDIEAGEPDTWLEGEEAFPKATEGVLEEVECLDGHATPICCIAIQDNLFATGEIVHDHSPMNYW